MAQYSQEFPGMPTGQYWFAHGIEGTSAMSSFSRGNPQGQGTIIDLLSVQLMNINGLSNWRFEKASGNDQAQATLYLC